MNKLSITMNGYEKTLGWIYYVLQLFIIPELIILALLLIGKTPTTLVVNFIFFTLNFMAMICVFHRFLWRNLKIAFQSWKRLVTYIAAGFVGYWVLNTLVYMLILNIYPNYLNLNNEAIATMAQGNFNLLAVGTILFVPLAEELVYRGLIFSCLYNRNKFLAYSISAAAFSLIHLIGYLTVMEPLHLLMSFIQYLPSGIILCFAYKKTDTILTPILIHTLINLIGIYAVR